jgi:hypothetical protein
MPTFYPIFNFASGFNGPEGISDEVKCSQARNCPSKHRFNRAVEFSNEFHGHKDTITQYSDYRPQLRLGDSVKMLRHICVGKQGRGTTDAPIPGSQPASAGLSSVESLDSKGLHAS